jgi:hypothetical protein
MVERPGVCTLVVWVHCFAMWNAMAIPCHSQQLSASFRAARLGLCERAPQSLVIIFLQKEYLKGLISLILLKLMILPYIQGFPVDFTFLNCWDMSQSSCWCCSQQDWLVDFVSPGQVATCWRRCWRRLQPWPYLWSQFNLPKVQASPTTLNHILSNVHVSMWACWHVSV